MRVPGPYATNRYCEFSTSERITSKYKFLLFICHYTKHNFSSSFLLFLFEEYISSSSIHIIKHSPFYFFYILTFNETFHQTIQWPTWPTLHTYSFSYFGTSKAYGPKTKVAQNIDSYMKKISNQQFHTSTKEFGQNSYQ